MLVMKQLQLLALALADTQKLRLPAQVVERELELDETDITEVVEAAPLKRSNRRKGRTAPPPIPPK